MHCNAVNKQQKYSTWHVTTHCQLTLSPLLNLDYTVFIFTFRSIHYLFTKHKQGGYIISFWVIVLVRRRKRVRLHFVMLMIFQTSFSKSTSLNALSLLRNRKSIWLVKTCSNYSQNLCFGDLVQPVVTLEQIDFDAHRQRGCLRHLNGLL